MRDVVQFVSFVAIVQVVRFVSGCFTWLFVVQVVYPFCEFQTGFNLFAFCRSLFWNILGNFHVKLCEVALFLFAFTLFGLHQLFQWF